MKRFLFIALALLTQQLFAATAIQTNSGTSVFGVIPTNSVTSGLKLWLTFDNWTWTSATVGTNTDLSGNGNHAGAASGVNRTNSSVPGLWGAGFSAQPAAPNGYLQCRSDSSIDDIQLQGGGGMSVAFAVLFRGGSANIISKGSSGGRWGISSLASGYPYGLSFTKSCATTAYVENFALRFHSNRFYYVVMTWNGGTVTNSTKLYVNGERSLSTTVTTGVGAVSSDAGNNLTVNLPGSTAFNGIVDEIRIYDHELSQSEIDTLTCSSMASQQFAVSANPFTATNLLSFENFTTGIAMTTAQMTNSIKGAAMGALAITGAGGDWIVATESNAVALNPITVAGVTYSSQSNALGCRLDTGTSSSLDYLFPAGGYGDVSGSFSFKIGLRQIASSGVKFDFFNVGAVSQSGVMQVEEGSGGFVVRGHSVSNGVTYGSPTVIIAPYIWYDAAFRWDTNAGKWHVWVFNQAYSSRLEDRHRLIYYSVSPIPVGTNCTFLGPCNNPHGTARAGVTNWYKFITWNYAPQTNAAMIALRSPFDGDIRQRFALNVLPLPIYFEPLSKQPDWPTTGELILANNNLIRASAARRSGPTYVMRDFKYEPVYWRKEWE